MEKNSKNLEEDKDEGNEEQNPLDKSLDSIGSKRGRPAIPDQWTRVF